MAVNSWGEEIEPERVGMEPRLDVFMAEQTEWEEKDVYRLDELGSTPLMCEAYCACRKSDPA